MKNITAPALVVAILASALISCRTQIEVPQGDDQQHACGLRRGSTCYPSVSIYSLIANPKDHDNKALATYGYMGIDDGLIYLYPTKQSYVGMDSISSIQLMHDNFDDAEIATLKSRIGKYVWAYGEFSVKYDLSRLGARTGSIAPGGVPEHFGNRVMDKDSTEIYTIIREIPEIDE